MAAVIQNSYPLPPIRLVRAGTFVPVRSRPGLDGLRRPSGVPASGSSNTAMTAVYRRRRLGVALTMMFLLVASAHLVTVVAAGRLASPPAAESLATEGLGSGSGTMAGAVASPIATLHVVRPGETLWSIARDLQPEGDVRPLVDHLARRHGGSALQAGERLDLDALRS